MEGRITCKKIYQVISRYMEVQHGSQQNPQFPTPQLPTFSLQKNLLTVTEASPQRGGLKASNFPGDRLGWDICGLEDTGSYEILEISRWFGLYSGILADMYDLRAIVRDISWKNRKTAKVAES